MAQEELKDGNSIPAEIYNIHWNAACRAVRAAGILQKPVLIFSKYAGNNSIDRFLSLRDAKGQRGLIGLYRLTGPNAGRFEPRRYMRHATLEPPTLSCEERAIIEALRKAGHRMTQLALLAAAGLKGDGNLKSLLGQMNQRGLIDNSQIMRPKGYGLPEWNGKGTK
jgi:hypothetical protein